MGLGSLLRAYRQKAEPDPIAIPSSDACISGFRVFRRLVLLKRQLPQLHKMRTLLHPLQPLQRRQLSKGAQAFVTDVVGAVASVESGLGLRFVHDEGPLRPTHPAETAAPAPRVDEQFVTSIWLN